MNLINMQTIKGYPKVTAMQETKWDYFYSSLSSSSKNKRKCHEMSLGSLTKVAPSDDVPFKCQTDRMHYAHLTLFPSNQMKQTGTNERELGRQKDFILQKTYVQGASDCFLISRVYRESLRT
jgi:hypothetical protein